MQDATVQITPINFIFNSIDRDAFLLRAKLPVRYKMKFETLFSWSAGYHF